MLAATDLNVITGDIVDCSMEVHSQLGPGLLESAYEPCLIYELRNRRYNVIAQLPMELRYKSITLEVGYRLDLLVEGEVVVELKAVEKLIPIHEAQLLSYLKLSGHRLGLLINFHALHLRDGIKRLVNNL
jgi:GxxExxY protein